MSAEKLAALAELERRGKLTPQQTAAFQELKRRYNPALEGGFFNGQSLAGLESVSPQGAQSSPATVEPLLDQHGEPWFPLPGHEEEWQRFRQGVVQSARSQGHKSDIRTVDLASSAPPRKEGSVQQDGGWRDSFVGGVVRGLRDVPDAGAQLVTRGLEAVAPAGSPFEEWARGQREEVEAINANAETDYRQNWRQGKDIGFDGGRMTGNIAGTLPLAAVVPGAGAATAAGRVGHAAGLGGSAAAMQPVYGDDFWTEKAIQTGVGAVAGPVAEKGMRVTAKAVSPHIRPVAEKMMKKGIRLTPGQIAGGWVKRTEDALTSVPVVGSGIKGAQRRSIEDFNRAVYDDVLEPLGTKLPRDVEVGHFGVKAVGDRISQAYDDVLDGVDIRLDDQFIAKMQELKGMVDFLPAPSQRLFNKQMKEAVAQRINAGGMDGKTYKLIDSDLKRLVRQYEGSPKPMDQEVGRALNEAVAAFDDLFARSAPDRAAQKAAADKSFAMLVRLEKASADTPQEAMGVFTPARLSMAAKGTSSAARKRDFARGEALMQGTAKDGMDILPQNIADSGTAERIANMALLGGGYAIDPTVAGAALAVRGAYTAPVQSGIRAAMTKRPGAANPVRGLLEYVAPVAPVGSAGLIGQSRRK